METKYHCEVVYKFHYGTSDGKEETCVKWFFSNEGDWLKCHHEAHEYASFLKSQGNQVKRMELLHTASSLVKNTDIDI